MQNLLLAATKEEEEDDEDDSSDGHSNAKANEDAILFLAVSHGSKYDTSCETGSSREREWRQKREKPQRAGREEVENSKLFIRMKKKEKKK